MKTEIKAIIGLGNPGAQYRFNRHNIGFLVVDAFVDQCGENWALKDSMQCATVHINGLSVLVVKPQTFMNSSGKVISFLQKKGIKPENMLVVHDELEKKFGTLAVRKGGSHRGHNGLRSLIEACGQEFWRLRFGIGRPDNKEDVSTYVLSNFQEENADINRLIDEAIVMIENFFEE
ncbi:aminoacyl-tRNA hydrolase [Candidatus Babeliales bacterium]|nr:aminoacyl-tRNA hydrolase [Candidatus Babeliales bacterium]